ncbi:hypothetical protein QQZ08_003433 [Neonectria magnoliae]|uniref:Uncharacterized protein n=1 Tax=Neonectria magnoliae TaxID=2732573 RepID=A0ABR1IAW1_9HYPO
MRDVASRNWKQELDSVLAAGRINFWTRLAYPMPNAWICASLVLGCRLQAVTLTGLHYPSTDTSGTVRSTTKFAIDTLNWLWHAFHPSNGLESSATLAFANAETEFEGCCNHCFMDYSVLVSHFRRTLTFQTWRDFGTHRSPENWTWKSQVKVENVNDAHNAYKTWDRVPGSVREQFEKSQN